MLSPRMSIQKKVWLEPGIRLSWQVICKPKVEHCSTGTRSNSIPSPPQDKSAWHQMHLPFHTSSSSIRLSTEHCFNYLLSKLSNTPVLEVVVSWDCPICHLRVCVCKFIFVSKEVSSSHTYPHTCHCSLSSMGKEEVIFLSFYCYILSMSEVLRQ